MALGVDVLHLSLLQQCLAGASVLSLVLVYLLYLRPNYLSPLAKVPGPKPTSLISGNLKEIFEGEAASLHTDWVERYGSVISYRGFMGENRLYVTDPRALNHILLNKSYEYPKPEQSRSMLSFILGRGILFAEGDDHKRQKRAMQSAFTQKSTNSYLPIFQEQANKLRARMDELLDDPAKEGLEMRGEYAVMEVSRWLSRATLDVIGLAGFDYAFNELDHSSEENRLAQVFRHIAQPRKITLGFILMMSLGRILPFLQRLPTKQNLAVKHAMSVMQGEGRKMLDVRRKQAEAGELEDKTDLLSLIVKANMDQVNKKERLEDDELMGQITTFMLAGHETSSVALTWILMFMTQHQDMQKKLRDEVRKAKADAAAEGRSELSVEELSSLPYMDAVVRETMRRAPPVHLTVREASHKDVIPLSEPIIGKDGKPISAIPVDKGTVIMIGIYTLNNSKALFGADAEEYRPERWLEENLEGRAKGFTAWAPLLTFLGGPRGCIGYRFALLEMKAILATLIDAYEFEERDVGGTAVTKRSNIVTRPVLVGEEDNGAQLPLRVKKAARP